MTKMDLKRILLVFLFEILYLGSIYVVLFFLTDPTIFGGILFSFFMSLLMITTVFVEILSKIEHSMPQQLKKGVRKRIFVFAWSVLIVLLGSVFLFAVTHSKDKSTVLSLIGAISVVFVVLASIVMADSLIGISEVIWELWVDVREAKERKDRQRISENCKGKA